MQFFWTARKEECLVDQSGQLLIIFAGRVDAFDLFSTAEVNEATRRVKTVNIETI
jgi:hypothetical protein